MVQVAPMEARNILERSGLRGMNRIFSFLFGEVGLTNKVFEERLHDFSHSFRVKLYAENRGILVFDSLYNPIGGAGRYAEKGRHAGDGLNVAGVDHETSYAQDVAQVRGILQFDSMGACAPPVAVYKCADHVPLNISIYAAPVQGIEQLHSVTDAQNGAVHAQASAEECGIGAGAHRVGFFYIVRQVSDQPLCDGRASGDNQAVKQVGEGVHGLLSGHGCDQGDSPRAFHGLHVVTSQLLFAVLE